ncbi:hypothetical protein OE88DRAFT_1330741 [Heliocybe sulcata]|uniref:Uncharacterized protein n=1 Tax=Heliocybe sulcata TaxID=5364 RepID=A0A5C3N878_9AGAM|nr:hypothetical protein OE88DRAFT_1330741 [Heliocybe sulcata]
MDAAGRKSTVIPPEILYEILCDILADFFHIGVMDEDRTDSWDTISILTQTSRLFRDVTTRIVKQALGSSRHPDGRWKVHPKAILSTMRRYGRLLRAGGQNVVSQAAMQCLLTLPKTPWLSTYIGIVTSRDSLERIREKSADFELRAWAGAYPPIAAMARKPVETSRSVKQLSLRRHE